MKYCMKYGMVWWEWWEWWEMRKPNIAYQLCIVVPRPVMNEPKVYYVSLSTSKKVKALYS